MTSRRLPREAWACVLVDHNVQVVGPGFAMFVEVWCAQHGRMFNPPVEQLRGPARELAEALLAEREEANDEVKWLVTADDA